jgi:hypothetical protein
MSNERATPRSLSQLEQKPELWNDVWVLGYVFALVGLVEEKLMTQQDLMNDLYRIRKLHNQRFSRAGDTFSLRDATKSAFESADQVDDVEAGAESGS